MLDLNRGYHQQSQICVTQVIIGIYQKKKKKKIKNVTKNVGALSGWVVKVIEILVLGQDSDLGENYCFLKNF